MKSIRTVTTYSCIKFHRFYTQQTTKDEKSSRHEDCTFNLEVQEKSQLKDIGGEPPMSFS